MSSEVTKEMPVCSQHNMNQIVGILLTTIDSWSEDTRVAEARKDLVKKIAWDWYDDLVPMSAYDATPPQQ